MGRTHCLRMARFRPLWHFRGVSCAYQTHLKLHDKGASAPAPVCMHADVSSQSPMEGAWAVRRHTQREARLRSEPDTEKRRAQKRKEHKQRRLYHCRCFLLLSSAPLLSHQVVGRPRPGALTRDEERGQRHACLQPRPPLPRPRLTSSPGRCQQGLRGRFTLSLSVALSLSPVFVRVSFSERGSPHTPAQTNRPFSLRTLPAFRR